MIKRSRAAALLLATFWTATAVLLLDTDVQTSSCTLYYMRDCLLAAQLNPALMALVWLGVFWLYRRTLFAPFNRQPRDILRGVLLTVPLAVVLALSPAYQQGDEALALFTSPYHLALLLFKFVGWVPLLFAIYQSIVMRLSSPGRPPLAASGAAPSPRRLNRAFGAYWLLLILCWLPSWLARFPGAVNDDASRALQQYFGEILATGDHPYAYTLLLGDVVRLGLLLGGGNLGIALFVTLQTLLLSGVFAYTLKDMERLRVSPAVRAAVFGFYAFLPVVCSYSAVIIKDMFYSAVFVGYSVMVSHALMNGPASRRRRGWWAAFLVFSCLLLLIRHNGKLVVWPTTLLLFIHCWRQEGIPGKRFGYGALLAAPVAAALLFQLFVAAPATLAVDSTPDVLGSAMQQTARIARDYGGDVTDGEREAIDRLLPYDDLAAAYTPRITDPVKRLYRYFDQVTWQEKLDFTGAWLGLTARHPLTAFNAFWALSSGYIDPLADGTAYIDRMTPSFSPKYAVTVSGTHPDALLGIRNRVLAAEAIWRELPLVSQLNNVGLYPWLLFLGMALLGRAGRRWYRWAYLPALATLVACLLSPGFYSCTRYAFPLVYGAPYLLVTTGLLVTGRDGAHAMEKRA